MRNTPCNTDDIIDSRDIIARIEELQENIPQFCAGWNVPGYLPDSEPALFVDLDDARQHLLEHIGLDSDIPESIAEIVEGMDAGDSAVIGGESVWITAVSLDHLADDPEHGDDVQELRVLLALQDEASYSPDWEHGETLVRGSYFIDYAQELAEDIGALDANAGWPNNCIDWEIAARELQYDYMLVSFDGVEYWIRS